MFWIVVLLLTVVIGGYTYWRVKGPGQYRYGEPQLYIVFPEKTATGTGKTPDVDFIRGLRLPDTGSAIKPHTRPQPAAAEVARAVEVDEPPDTVVVSPPAVPPSQMAPTRVETIPARFELGPIDGDLPQENGYGDPTLQLLPGRLEITSGMSGNSVRFVKQPGVKQEITLGRSRGKPGGHVHVPSPTVSRLHVCMKYANGGWAIENLSETNPVSINGQQAAGRGAECALSDGDRIEMGEVAFVFRKR
ncbi:MAG: FHA domain-containing protein [Longimicrobiales bacterium]